MKNRKKRGEGERKREERGMYQSYYNENIDKHIFKKICFHNR